MNLDKYDGIVFDFDGTLVDSNQIKSRAFGKLYESHGLEIVSKVLAYQNKHTGVSRFIKFKYWQENLLGQSYTDKLGEQLSSRYSKLVIEEVVNAPFIDGALEFLENYHQIFPLFVASGTPEPELIKIVKLRKMERFFQGVYGSPSTKKQILIHILKQNKWSPNRVLMVGDSLTDSKGAKGSKVCFIRVDRDLKIADQHIDQNIKNLHELRSLI